MNPPPLRVQSRCAKVNPINFTDMACVMYFLPSVGQIVRLCAPCAVLDRVQGENLSTPRSLLAILRSFDSRRGMNDCSFLPSTRHVRQVVPTHREPRQFAWWNQIDHCFLASRHTDWQYLLHTTTSADTIATPFYKLRRKVECTLRAYRISARL